MPKVPTYESNVRENSIPTNRVPMEAPLSAFGGGEAVAGVFSAAERLAVKGRDAADVAAITEANTEATKLKNRILFGETSSDGKVVPGALQTQGRNAFGLPEEVQKQYEEGIQKISSNLNFRQQNIFKKVSDEISLSLNERVSSHTAGEVYKYQVRTMESSASASQQDAINNFANEKDVQMSLSKMSSAIAYGGKVAGMDQEQVKETIALKVSETHQKIVERFLNEGNLAGAEDYFKKNYNSVLGQDKSEIEKKLLAGTNEAKAFKLSDDLTSDSALRSGMTEQKALKFLRGEANADIRKIAEQRVEHFFRVKAQQRDESQKNISIAMANILDENGGDTSDPRYLNIVRNATIDLRGTGDTYAEYVRNGRSKSANPIEYDDLEGRLLSSDPEIRNSVTQAEISDLTKQIPQRGERSRDALLKLWSMNARNDEALLRKVGDFGVESDLIKQKISEVGIKNKNKQKLFESRAKEEIQIQQRLQEKPLNKEQKQKIVDDLALKDSVGFFGQMVGAQFGESAAQMFGKYRFEESVDNIPENVKDEISQILVKRNVEVNDDNILRLYNSRKPKD